MSLNTPFGDVMPALSAEKYSLLKADIEQAGLMKSIVIDEMRNIIDGHHRYRACSELGVAIKTEVCSGIGDDQDKRIRIIALNLAERDLSSSDRKRLDAERKNAAMKLLAEGRGIREVARLVGKPHNTVLGWRDAGRLDHPTQPPATTPKPTANRVTDEAKDGKKKEEKMTQADADALKQKVIGLHRGGMRSSEIEDATGLSRKTIAKWIVSPDAAASTRGYNGGTKKRLDDSDVERLVNDGRSRDEIAQELGVTVQTVGSALKRLGLGRAGRKALNPLVDHIDNADAHASAWSISADVIVAAASVSSASQVAELTKALTALSGAVATLKRRLNKEAGKED